MWTFTETLKAEMNYNFQVKIWFSLNLTWNILFFLQWLWSHINYLLCFKVHMTINYFSGYKLLWLSLKYTVGTQFAQKVQFVLYYDCIKLPRYDKIENWKQFKSLKSLLIYGKKKIWNWSRIAIDKESTWGLNLEHCNNSTTSIYHPYLPWK